MIEQENDPIHLSKDEFALLIHQEIDSAYLHYLLDAIYQPFLLNDESLQISVSIGVTYFPYDDSAEEVLLRHAIQAMYQAKQLGGNAYRIFDFHENHRRQRHRTECQHFIEALNRQELCLYYQPQVDILSRQVVGSGARMLEQRQGDPNRLPPHTVLEIEDIVSQQATRSLRAGTTLSNHQVQEITWVLRGQRISVKAKGQGFRVTREGEALEDGAQGETIRVRLSRREILEAMVIRHWHVAVAF